MKQAAESEMNVDKITTSTISYNDESDVSVHDHDIDCENPQSESSDDSDMATSCSSGRRCRS